jgi:SAM-dependent methyltransferase
MEEVQPDVQLHRRVFGSMLKSSLVGVFRSTDAENQRVILESLPHSPGCRVLDLGCGDGSFTERVAARTAAGEVAGIELVPDHAALAEARGFDVRRADLGEPFPFPDAHFDVVHSNQVIEHLHGTDNFLRESARVVRPGGTVIHSTNNLASWHNVFSLFLGWQPLPAHVSDEVILGNPANPYGGSEAPVEGQTHLRIFTGRALRDLAEHHGLEVKAVKGAGYYPFPPRAARLLARIDRRHAAYLVLLATRPQPA